MGNNSNTRVAPIHGTDWSKLKKSPTNGQFISRLIRTLDGYILVEAIKSSCIIYKYIIKENKWIKWIKLSYPFDISKKWRELIKATFCIKTNTLYIINPYWKTMWSININNDSKWNAYHFHHDIIALTHKESYFWINDTLHLINGIITHLIMENGKLKALKPIKIVDEEYEYSPCRGSGMIYNKEKQSLLLFGGYVFGMGIVLDTIYEYFCKNNELVKLEKIKMPYKADNFLILSTDDCKVIILFLKEGIFVFDTENQRFLKSNVDLPQNIETSGYIYDGVLVEDKLFSVLLVSGYIKQILRNTYLPNDIINLIVSMCYMRFVHLLDYKGKHYKILLDTILANTRFVS